MKCQLLILTIVVLLFACKNQVNNDAQTTIEITDMAGRKVMVPKEITKVFCSDMAISIFAYSIVPDLLVGINTPLNDRAKAFLTLNFCQLPAMGRIFLNRSELNYEELIKIQPQILLCPLFEHTKQTDIDKYEQVGKILGATVICVDLELNKLHDSYLFIGSLFKKDSQARQLAMYCQQTIAFADSVKRQHLNPISVYIAEGDKGLRTIPDKSTHSKVFDRIGLKNCATVDEKFGFTDMCINLEQVFSWNPDYILLSNIRGDSHDDFSEFSDTWQSLPAIRQHKVLRVPDIPFNWIGRPPSINRLIGIRWLIHSFYPKKTSVVLEDEIRQFYRLFYHVNVSNEIIKQLLKQ